MVSCNQSPYSEGERVYAATCQNCHMKQGDGLGQLIPPLINSDYYQANLDNLSCIIRHGITDTITVNGIAYTTPMAGLDVLSDIQITNLINYMNHRWYPDLPLVTLEEVKNQLGKCE